MEAELVAALEMARELLGLREMLSKFGVGLVLPMKRFVANQEVIIRISG
uniref:Uncharacterized protein n=1 Tax=Peronospora matthiolae TaxID=2874970 RepID=A0AAV1TF26_9STRA